MATTKKPAKTPKAKHLRKLAINWATRDREVANQRAADAVKERELVRKKRCELLRSDECRFPLLAIEHAATVGQPRSDGTMLSDTLAIGHARRFTVSDRRVLVLAGGVGTTKTTAATWLAIDPDIAGSAPGFLRAGELEARGRYDRHAEKGDDLRSWLRTRTMLVLDDLGAEYMDSKNAFRSLLDEVLDLLYGDRKRVVITTNLHAKKDPKRKNEEPQFVERYGERVSSRLYEVGIWGECGAEDMRRKKKP
jgi:DNA replication protein DnaC